MLIIPAIDILGGKCVRLYKGDYNKVEVYHDSPLEQAKIFEGMGVKRLHVVDLDGAKEGKPVNQKDITEICSKTNMEIECGGGIRNISSAKAYIDLGVKKIILGSALAQNPRIAVDFIHQFGKQRLIAGIDFKDNQFVISGWEQGTGKDPLEFAVYLENLGVEEFIFTDVSKDGTLNGPNAGFYKIALSELKGRVIASGGIGSDMDIETLSGIKNLHGVIIGKAYYEKKVNLEKFLNK